MKVPKRWIKIREIYPRFCFRECEICGMLVKKEPVWKFKTNYLNMRFIRHAFTSPWDIPTIYLCKECCPTISYIYEILGVDKDSYHLK